MHEKSIHLVLKELADERLSGRAKKGLSVDDEKQWKARWRDFARFEQSLPDRVPHLLKKGSDKVAYDILKQPADGPRRPAELRAALGIARLVRDNVKEGPEPGFSAFGDGKDRFPRDAAKVVSFDVPGRLLRDFYNAVELEPSYGTPGNLVWAQFRLRESPRTRSPTAAPPPRAP